MARTLPALSLAAPACRTRPGWSPRRTVPPALGGVSVAATGRRTPVLAAAPPPAAPPPAAGAVVAHSAAAQAAAAQAAVAQAAAVPLAGPACALRARNAPRVRLRAGCCRTRWWMARWGAARCWPVRLWAARLWVARLWAAELWAGELWAVWWGAARCWPVRLWAAESVTAGSVAFPPVRPAPSAPRPGRRIWPNLPPSVRHAPLGGAHALERPASTECPGRRWAAHARAVPSWASARPADPLAVPSAAALKTLPLVLAARQGAVEGRSRILAVPRGAMVRNGAMVRW